MDENPPTSLPSTSGQSLPTERLSQDNNRRCRKCILLDISRLLRWKEVNHHSSLEALERSAGLGCDFCQFIVDCLKIAQAEIAPSRERRVSVRWNSYSYSDWEYSGQSLYTNAQEWDQPSSITFTIDQEDFLSIPSSGVHSSEIPDTKVYETLLVKVGDLPQMELNLIVSRGDNIYLDTNGKYHSQDARHRVGRYPIDPDLGSPVNLSIAKGWLDDCRKAHAECRPVKASSLPTRVLDVAVSEGSHTCRLVETGNQQGNYVALSHCWGDKIKECLTTKTLSSFLCSIQIAQLPANFRDAIHVTQQLGMRYLWIDALCILQDSKKDWASGSEKMGSIYQNSTLTIFAMTSKGSEEGFLKTADPPYPSPKILKVFSAADNQTSVLVSGREVEEENIGMLRLNSALSNRGWAFQEVILSNRSLFFGTQQLYWQCRKGLDSLEGLYPPWGTRGKHIRVTVPRTDGQPERSDDRSAKSDFYTLASEYSGKALTYSSDKLPAFSGLAQKFQHVFGGEYLAGLWSNHIHF
ncbi:HET domain-containing protein [Fusarium sp. LHS14.1]|nr:HET domain-containing protein [Fusarium sp. LHS14.1]